MDWKTHSLNFFSIAHLIDIQKKYLLKLIFNFVATNTNLCQIVKTQGCKCGSMFEGVEGNILSSKAITVSVFLSIILHVHKKGITVI
jgi:hypothetical protein